MYRSPRLWVLTALMSRWLPTNFSGVFDLGSYLSDMKPILHRSFLYGYRSLGELPDNYHTLIDPFFLGSMVGTFSFGWITPHATAYRQKVPADCLRLCGKIQSRRVFLDVINRYHIIRFHWLWGISNWIHAKANWLPCIWKMGYDHTKAGYLSKAKHIHDRLMCNPQFWCWVMRIAYGVILRYNADKSA